MADVFISYSHKDSEYAHRLAEELRDQQLDVWIDDRIDYGDRWPRVIEENLAGCRVFIVIMSTNAFNSTWVQNEVSYAQDNDKLIFPMLLEGRVWLSLASMQYVDVRNGLMPPRKFADKLKRALGQPVLPAAEPKMELRPQPTLRKSARPWAIGIGALFLLCLTTGVIYGVLKANPGGTGQGPGALAPEPTEGPTKPHPTPPGPSQPPPTDVPPTDVPPTEIPPTQVPPTEHLTQPSPPTEDPFAGEFSSRDFHLAVGDERIYKFGSASEIEGGVVEQLGEVTERVVALEGESNALMEVFRVERSGDAVGLDCNGQAAPGEVQMLWYIRDETRLFTACNQDEKAVIVDALLREQLMFAANDQAELSAPSYVFPIAIDAKWNYWIDIPVEETGRYGWHVETAIEQQSTFAGSFANCYQISLRTNPDITMRTVCKGVGMVAWFYRHFGTQNDSAGKLSSYKFSP